MFNILKFEHTEDSKVYFWGCPHVFHQQEFIWQKRGYSSVIEHAKAIKTKINTTCTEKDKLILLGDGFLNSNPDQVQDFLFSLKPTIYYLWGNHESSTTKLYRKYLEYQYGKLIELNKITEIYPLHYKNLVFCGNYLECIINKEYCVVGHYPISIFNWMKHGSLNICSHSHGNYKKSSPSNKEIKQLDVGVDVFPNNPIAFDEILVIMNKKSIPKLDHHT